MRVSLVLPARNEAGSIGGVVEEIYRRVPPAMLGEVIVVDDAGSDATPELIKALITKGQLTGLHYLRHEANCGPAAALRSGVLAARFPIVVTLEPSGQNDPADVTRLVERLAVPGAAGPALACGWRTRRRGSRLQRWSAGIGRLVRRLMLGDTSPDAGCGIRAFWRDAFLLLPHFAANSVYLPVLFRSHGHEVVHVPVNDRLTDARSSSVREAGSALDLLAVAWLRRRTRLPVIIEQWPDGGLEATRPIVKRDARHRS